MIIVPAWKIIVLPAWNFKYQVKLFCMVIFPQYYNALILNEWMNEHCFYKDCNTTHATHVYQKLEIYAAVH